MARVDRLYEMREVLRRGGLMNLRALAEQFGVSERTVERDLAVLRRHAIIEGTHGPRGGVRLIERHRTSASALMLSDEEAVALWLAVWATASRGGAIESQALRAFQKVEQALPTNTRTRLRAISRRVFVGHAAGEHLAAAASPPRPSVVAALAGPFARRTAMRLIYEDAERKRSVRSVEPHALLVQAPLMYLLAYDRDRAAPRMFRLDRIQRATPLDSAITSRLDVWRAFDLGVAGVRRRST